MKIDISKLKWLKDKDLRHVFNLLNSSGGKALFVGGCVRDSLLGFRVNDIDIASSLSPEENMKILENAGIKTIPTGLKHGTITAFYKSVPYEITTLRRDAKTDGRRAIIEYTNDWQEDALRRDFTINALYLDASGELLDYFDGFKDVSQKKVRFIGKAEQRIEEDALRILRFFRFSSMISGGTLDGEGLRVCILKKHLIASLSGERINQEMKKIILSDAAIKVLQTMEKEGVLAEILTDVPKLSLLYAFIKFEQERGGVNLYSRLVYLAGSERGGIIALAKKWHLSAKEKKQMLLLISIKNELVSYKAVELRRYIYLYSKEALTHYVKRQFLKGQAIELDEILEFICHYQVPVFPIKGADLLKQGQREGKEVGRLLSALESQWIESDFSQDKAQILKNYAGLT